MKMWRGQSAKSNPIVNEANRIRKANLPSVLPEVFEIGEWHGRPYFVMERLEDVDWPLPDKAYRRVAIEAFEALALLHGRRILHCDITTRHLVLKNGRVSLLDLDNARTFEEAVSNRDSIGTDNPIRLPICVEKDGVRYSCDIADDTEGIDWVITKA